MDINLAPWQARRYLRSLLEWVYPLQTEVFCWEGQKEGSWREGKSEMEQVRRKEAFTKESCWFCLWSVTPTKRPMIQPCPSRMLPFYQPKTNRETLVMIYRKVFSHFVSYHTTMCLGFFAGGILFLKKKLFVYKQWSHLNKAKATFGREILLFHLLSKNKRFSQ